MAQRQAGFRVHVPCVSMSMSKVHTLVATPQACPSEPALRKISAQFEQIKNIIY
jgi:hypothetical protein